MGDNPPPPKRSPVRAPAADKAPLSKPIPKPRSTTPPPLMSMEVQPAASATSSAALTDAIPVHPKLSPPLMAADSHFHLQQLLGTHGKYTSLGEALGTSTPTPVIVDPVVPSYCWPNTWQEILWSHPPEARYAALGWHPILTAHLSDALLETFYELVVECNIKAVEEVGLDYDRIWIKPKEEKKHLIQQQKKLLRVMCEMARDRGLPMVIHCQDAPDSDDASKDCMNIMSSILPEEYPVYLHCFNQAMGMFSRWLQVFKYVVFGISPIILNPSDHHPELPRVVRNLAGGRFLIETDAPYLGPSSTEGKGPAPTLVYWVAEQIKSWRQELSVKDVLQMAREATLQFYRI